MASPPPSPNAANPRYRLTDTVTGSDHAITYGSELLANVVNTPQRLAEDAKPASLDGDISEFFNGNGDPANSNFLRPGGFGNMSNGNYCDPGFGTGRRTNGGSRDQMYENPVDPAMRGDPGDPDMPGRGRCGPAAVWNYANGSADAALDPDSLHKFVDGAVRQFDPDERAHFFTLLAATLDMYDDNPSGNGNNNNGTPEQQAGALRRTGDRRQTQAQAQDSALARRYRNTDGFLSRFPEAAHIKFSPFGR